MIHVMASSVLNAPVSSVWGLIRDFGALGRLVAGREKLRDRKR